MKKSLICVILWQLALAHLALANSAQTRPRFGLFPPQEIDAAKPLVIVLHGLDGSTQSCMAIGDRLTKDGFQVALFAYPSEQPLAESERLLDKAINHVQAAYHGLHIDLVTISMGGLIARDYLEGDGYDGHVDHLIMVAPPTHGSSWAPLQPILAVVQSFKHLRQDPDWSSALSVYRGISAAGKDLKPGSAYLTHLNARPRRAGVTYTIIAGDKPITLRLAEDFLRSALALLPPGMCQYWAVQQLKTALDREVDYLASAIGTSDGPVSLTSAKLDGVTDFVVLPADHLALYYSIHGQPPAAYDTIKDRLGK